MATLKYFLRSKNDNSNIFVRYSINRETRLIKKTGFIINAKDWSEANAQPIQRSQELKALKSKLDKLANFINDAYNNSVSVGDEFTGDWLQLQIDLYNKKTPVLE
jgi:hypothetical protein